VTFDPLGVVFFVVSLVPAMLFHELAHGWMAVRLGDPTPRFMGRQSLDLRRHVDPFGTIVVPVLLLLPVLFGRGGLAFGYLKPIPIRRENLRDPDRQMTWIALAGIAASILLAALGALLYRLVGVPVGGPVQRFLTIWVYTNVFLGVLHIVPVPPLDGSRILARFLTGRAREVYESWDPYGALFILFLLFLVPAPILGVVDAVASGLLAMFVGG
jgi:Zn-dependent protease